MGIEPTLQAWEACVLPLNYTRERYLWQYSITKFAYEQKEISIIIFLRIRQHWKYNVVVVIGWSLKVAFVVYDCSFQRKVRASL